MIEAVVWLGDGSPHSPRFNDRYRPGTTLASYSVALSVRKDLKQFGFCVKKCKGLPPKRHRLQAIFSPPI
jgi:tRNA U34 5-methylaminomethyl-2-thiouridine-forming methyltransferase MnmC